MQNSATKKLGNGKLTVILLLLVLAIIIVPQIIQKGAEFGGADGEAEAAITEINHSFDEILKMIIYHAIYILYIILLSQGHSYFLTMIHILPKTQD